MRSKNTGSKALMNMKRTLAVDLKYPNGALKTFSMRPVKDDNLKLKLEETQIPSNCKFLQPEKTNPEIFSVILWLQFTHDCKMQGI